MLSELGYFAFISSLRVIKAAFDAVYAVPDVVARNFILLRLKLGFSDIMDSGDNNISNNLAFLEPEESKGGLKFEVIYAEPTSPPPSKTLPLSPKSMISVENIDNKLKAATDRRRTIEAVKLQQFNDKNSRIEEVNLKKQERDANFKRQSKVQLEQKIVSATEAREAQITALLERLREHEKHIADVRKQMEQQTDQLRERLQKKLEQAQEKRQSMLKDLQTKQAEHLSHVQVIRLSRSASCEPSPEGNENAALGISG